MIQLRTTVISPVCDRLCRLCANRRPSLFSLNAAVYVSLAALFLVCSSACARRSPTGGVLECVVDGRKACWRDVHIQVSWSPGLFHWFFWMCSDRPAPNSSDTTECDRRTEAPVTVCFSASPTTIASITDVRGKTFLSRDFTLIFRPSSNENQTVIKGGLGGKNIQVLKIVFDRWDVSAERVIGHFEGTGRAVRSGLPHRVVQISNGRFNVPIWRVNPEMTLPKTQDEATAIWNTYSINHLVRLETIRRAATRHDADAEWQLGNMYEIGDGVTRDHQAALAWWKKAAEDGAQTATVFLANASTVPATQYFWREVAASRCHARCKSVGEPEKQSLTKAQVSQIKRSIRRWLKSHQQPSSL